LVKQLFVEDKMATKKSEKSALSGTEIANS